MAAPGALPPLSIDEDTDRVAALSTSTIRAQQGRSTIFR